MLRLTFRRALIISFLWHAFCFFAVIIVISPVGMKEERFSKINFIGPILDKDIFGYHSQQDTFNREIAKKMTAHSAMAERASVSFAEERLKRAATTKRTYKPYGNSITEIIKEKKGTEETALAQGPKIESEAATRQVIFKPPTPVISRAFRAGKSPAKGEKFQIKLMFIISPEGKIVFIEKLKSCGYPDVDLIAIKHMKEWQFAPLPSDKPKRNQEGILFLELQAQ